MKIKCLEVAFCIYTLTNIGCGGSSRVDINFDFGEDSQTSLSMTGTSFPTPGWIASAII